MAKIKDILLTVLAFVAMLLMAACGNKAAQELALEVENVDQSVRSAVTENPGLLTEASAQMGEGTVNVNLTFTDIVPSMSTVDRGIVDFFLAQVLRANAGRTLDAFVNTLSKAKYKMQLTLTSPDQSIIVADYTAVQLAKLLTAKPAQLSFNEVKSFVLDMLSARGAALFAPGQDCECSFELAHGFGAYTMTFANDRSYINLSPANLMSRELKCMRAWLEPFGNYSGLFVDSMKALGIDGLRFIYRTADGRGKQLNVSVPWRQL